MSQRKRYANLRVTYEMLSKLLGLDDTVQIDSIQADPNRHLVNIFISSALGEPTNPRTYERAEGQEILQTTLEMGTVIERMRQMVQEWDEQHADESAQAQSREAMNTLYEQMRSSRENQ